MEAKFDNPQVQAEAIRQEWESFRYQDGLRWSKIQTVAVIEAAFLAAVYSKPTAVPLLAVLCFAVLVSLLVLAICALAEKDGRDAKYHMLRAEKLLPLREGTGIRLPDPVFSISGHLTMRIAMILLNVLNIVVVVEIITRWWCA